MFNLLPFNFSRIAGKEVLVNEAGDMLISPEGTVEQIVNKTLPKNELYKSLVANFFIYEGDYPHLLDIYAEKLREKKRFLDNFTGLHIFVLTLCCNQNCVYCQASSQEENKVGCTMSKETMKRSVELMFSSPSPYLTMEFQGGEPSLVPDILEYGMSYATSLNQVYKRQLKFVLCTNCVNLTERVLSLCKEYDVLISTSLDGPAFLHNRNRGKVDSYERVVAGIEKARSTIGKEKVSALMTTSYEGLNYPIEIVDEYAKLGFQSIFLRALNPYGLATDSVNWEEYTQRFVEFYKKAFERIITINKSGTLFMEEFAAIVLRKMLTPYSTGFVDLQSPAGIINSVLVYNYDGYVYASDESRMLAEFNDYTFRLGSVKDDYQEIVYGQKVRDIATVWCNECLAGCAECGIRAYCGADPVRNHSTQRDAYGYRPTSLLCQKYKAIIEYLISLIIERESEVLPIFKRWLV